jgi:peroxiredoxin
MSRRVLILGLVFCCFALIFWSGYQHRSTRSSIQSPPSSAIAAQSAATGRTDDPGSPLLNKPAPGFVLRDLAGRHVSLADYRGKALLINFWATWCAPCRVEMPWFIALQQKYAQQGFTILGIDSDYPEDLPKVPGFAKRTGLNYPVVYSNQQVEKNYGCCDYLPMSYYIDRSGIIRVATIGLGDRNTIESYIRHMLEESPPQPGIQPDAQITTSAAATP